MMIAHDTRTDRVGTDHAGAVRRFAVAAALLLTALIAGTFTMHAQNGTIGGHVYEDVNGNGIHDSSDVPLPGMRIVVVDTATRHAVRELLTDGKGGYAVTLADSAVKVVSVALEIPEGWSLLSPTSVRYDVETRSGRFDADFLLYHEAVVFPFIPPCTSTYWFWDCRRTLLAAGTADNFSSTPDPKATPSSQYVQYLRGRGLNFDSTFDSQAQDRVFAHTFTIPACPNGQSRRIVSATLTIRVRGNGGIDYNDALSILDVTNAATPVSVWGQYLATLNGGSWGGTPTTFVLNLAAMPPGISAGGPTNILSTLQDGALDIFLQDDSGIDFMTLDVEYCCLTPATGDCIIEPTIDTNCCSYNFRVSNNSASPITKIEYATAGGTVNSISAAGCANTVTPASASSGTVTFVPACATPVFPIQLSTSPDAANGTGWISLTLKVYHQNGGMSVTTQRFKCRRAPLSRCDELKWSQYSFDPNNISGRTFTIANQKLPVSPITFIGVRFTPANRPSDGLALLVNGGSLSVNGGPAGTAWGPAPNYAQRIPNAPLTLAPSATAAVSFWLGLDRLQLWDGVVEFTVHHADGDSCTLTSAWKTTPVVVVPGPRIRSVRPKTGDLRLVATQVEIDPTTDSGRVGWIVIELPDTSGHVSFFSVGGSTLAADGAAVTGDDSSVRLETWQGTARTILKVDAPFHGDDAAAPDSVRVPIVLAMDSAGGARQVPLAVTFFTADGRVCGTARLTIDSSNSMGTSGGRPPIASVTIGAGGSVVESIEIAPNPARHECGVTFSVAERSAVEVEVYDLDGRLVARSAQGVLEPGTHTAMLATSALPSGTYYLRVVGPHGSVSRLMTVTK